MDRASDAASSPFTLLPKKNSTRVEIVNSDGVFGSLIFLFLPFFLVLAVFLIQLENKGDYRTRPPKAHPIPPKSPQ